MQILRKNNGLRNFVIRLIVFFTLYTLISVFHADILFRVHLTTVSTAQPWLLFLIYPILIFFVYLRWDKLKKISNYKNSIIQTIIFGGIALALILTDTIYVIRVFGFNEILAYYLPLLLGQMFLFLSIFNIKFIRTFSSESVVIGLALGSYLTINILVENYWWFFSDTIMVALKWVIPLFSETAVVNPETYYITVNGFSVIVGPPCAGIYSLVTFALLFLLSLFFLSRTKKIKYFSAAISLILGLISVFILNIIRVAIILLVGGFYSQELAINLFHEYLSAIFLIGIFSIYLYFVIPKIIKNK